MNRPSLEDKKRRILRAIYERLLEAYGPQQWWPAETPFEVMVGAVLVQNTNWTNVEKAIAALKKHDRLTFDRMKVLPDDELAALIRPAGYFRIKARRLRNLLEFLGSRCQGDVRKLRSGALPALREELLSVNGIGPETADSILLYALGKPVFVVDAYTRRLLARHGFSEAKGAYAEIQALFHQHIPADSKVYNEYHALIVRLGKEYKGGAGVRSSSDYPLKQSKFFLKALREE